MGVGIIVGRSLLRAAKWAFVVPKKSNELPMPPVWQLKQRAIYKAAKAANDHRLDAWRLPHTPIDQKELVREGLQELPHDNGVCADYLQQLIQGAKNTTQIQTIRDYLQSVAASNLDAHTKTELWLACNERLHFIETLLNIFT